MLYVPIHTCEYSVINASKYDGFVWYYLVIKQYNKIHIRHRYIYYKQIYFLCMPF